MSGVGRGRNSGVKRSASTEREPRQSLAHHQTLDMQLQMPDAGNSYATQPQLDPHAAQMDAGATPCVEWLSHARANGRGFHLMIMISLVSLYGWWLVATG